MERLLSHPRRRPPVNVRGSRAGAAVGVGWGELIDLSGQGVTLLDEVAAALAGIPEVRQVQGISGQSDLMVRVVRADADDLYRILAVESVERTATALVMRELVDPPHHAAAGADGRTLKSSEQEPG
jgi:DNA-binding Lrp family transcriptional regulator